MPAIRGLVPAVLISATCLAPLAASADEAASRWSFGTQVGVAKGQGDSEQATTDPSTYSYDVSATFGDKSRLGWRVFTGYRFTDYLALHVGYTDLGEVASGGVEEERLNQGFLSGQSGSVQTIRGVDVGMQVKIPLGERVAVDLRGGKYYWQSRTRSMSVWGDEFHSTRRDSDVFFGAGLEVAVLEEFSTTLGWTRYNVAGEPIALWTVGALYRFSVF